MRITGVGPKFHMHHPSLQFHLDVFVLVRRRIRNLREVQLQGKGNFAAFLLNVKTIT